MSYYKKYNKYKTKYLLLKKITGGTLEKITGGTLEEITGGTLEEITSGPLEEITSGPLEEITGGTLEENNFITYKKDNSIIELLNEVIENYEYTNIYEDITDSILGLSLFLENPKNYYQCNLITLNDITKIANENSKLFLDSYTKKITKISSISLKQNELNYYQKYIEKSFEEPELKDNIDNSIYDIKKEYGEFSTLSNEEIDKLLYEKINDSRIQEISGGGRRKRKINIQKRTTNDSEENDNDIINNLIIINLLYQYFISIFINFKDFLFNIIKLLNTDYDIHSFIDKNLPSFIGKVLKFIINNTPLFKSLNFFKNNMKKKNLFNVIIFKVIVPLMTIWFTSFILTNGLYFYNEMFGDSLADKMLESIKTNINLDILPSISFMTKNYTINYISIFICNTIIPQIKTASIYKSAGYIEKQILEKINMPLYNLLSKYNIIKKEIDIIDFFNTTKNPNYSALPSFFNESLLFNHTSLIKFISTDLVADFDKNYNILKRNFINECLLESLIKKMNENPIIKPLALITEQIKSFNLVAPNINDKKILNSLYHFIK
jgi:hypothetical protein